MNKTLIISGHPNLKNSISNQTIIHILQKELNFELHDIASKYPNYDIDVQQEQEKILKYETLFFQFPIHWCTVPGILKLWIDKVILNGFAFGTNYLLKGKNLYQSVTLAGNDTPESIKNVSEKMMFSLQGVTKHCKMNYRGEFALYGMNYSLSDNTGYFKKKAEKFAYEIIKML